jgi:pimeloyl-ACP methyl ester carboxylesterase
VSLAYTAAGVGAALVFVPWVPFSNLRVEWQNPLLHKVFERLAQRLTVIHYDGRGTGHSQRDVTDLSLEAMVGDLEAVIDRAGATEVNLLAQYNSYPHAIAYAARHPRRVSASVLILGAVRGAGQGQRMLDEAGMKSSASMAQAETAARAVIKAVRKDKAELVVPVHRVR